MANNSWTTARVLNRARDFDRIAREINNTVNQAQGWNPRAWIQITDIQAAGRDVLFKLQTDWQNGDRVAAAVAEALGMTVKGSFSGECDPPKGTFTFGAQAARSKPSRGAGKAAMVAQIVQVLGCDATSLAGLERASQGALAGLLEALKTHRAKAAPPTPRPRSFNRHRSARQIDRLSAQQQWDAVVVECREYLKHDTSNSGVWLSHAYALRRCSTGSLEQAYEVLASSVGRFPTVWTFSYNMACYLCQMGRIKEASIMLSMARSIDATAVDKIAGDDDDLAPLH